MICRCAGSCDTFLGIELGANHGARCASTGKDHYDYDPRVKTTTDIRKK